MNILTFQKVCRDFKCNPGKVFLRNSCVPLLSVTVNLCYKFASRIKVTIDNRLVNSSTDLHILGIIINEIKDFIGLNLNQSNLKFHREYFVSDNVCELQSSLITGYIVLEFCTNRKQSINRLSAEKFLVNLTAFHITKNVSNMTLSIKLIDYADAYGLLSKLNTFIIALKCIFRHVTEMTVNESVLITYRVNDLLLCPQVALEKNEFILLNNHQVKLTISDSVIGLNDFFELGDGTLQMCASKYKDIISTLQENVTDLPNLIIMTICNVASITCLFLAFITYSLFSSLRTMPGIYNMVLIFCLLSHNVLFQIRIFHISADVFCKVLGFLQHFFFLAMFSSFSVCTFNIYKIFTNPTPKSNSRNKLQVILKYNLFIFGLPLLFISCNTVLTLFVYDLDSFGYGGENCFVLYKLAAILTVLLPVGLLLLGNSVLFVIAMYHICTTPQVKKGQASHERRNDVVIFFKLFTISGCSWLLQFIDALLPKSAFTYLVSICNLSVGVVIFASYICNKRVYNLYKFYFANLKNGGLDKTTQ